MFRFLLLIQLFALVTPRTSFALDDSVFKNEMNDPNLNPGFDLEAFRTDQLDLHNHYRLLHGAPLMTRSENLTTQAQEFAEFLAGRNGDLIHCSELPDCDPYGAGENLASARGSVAAETNATKAWYDEIWDYNFCYELNGNGATRPGHEGKAIGHFTQVVWEGSTQLGIGYARNADRTAVYVVARYKPPGNIRTLYQQNVKVPSFILDTLQNNCNGVNGGFTDWMGPGECTRSCGGGVGLNSRTCTNPKPSLNGRDCAGQTKELASNQWCNSQTYDGCPSEAEYRNLQCSARGFPSGRHHNFGGTNECILYCFLSGTNTVSNAGAVDDGTHCSIGACVNGVCNSMVAFVPIPGTPPPPTQQETTTTQPPPKTTTTQPPSTPPETTTTQPPPTPGKTTTTQPPPTPLETTTTQPPPTPPKTTTTQPPSISTETTTTQPPPTPRKTTATQAPPSPPKTTTTQPLPTHPKTTTTQPLPTPPETTTTQPPPTPRKTTTTQPLPTPPKTTTTQAPPNPTKTTTTQPPPIPTITITTQPPPTPPNITTTQSPSISTETTTTAPPTTPSIVTDVFRATLRRPSFRALVIIPSGGRNITLIKINFLQIIFYFRFRRTTTNLRSKRRIFWRRIPWRRISRQCPTSQRECNFPNVTVPDGFQLELAFYVLRDCKLKRVWVWFRHGGQRRRGGWSRRARRGRWVTRRVCRQSNADVSIRYQYYI